jgi:hypothetical protein
MTLEQIITFSDRFRILLREEAIVPDYNIGCLIEAKLREELNKEFAVEQKPKPVKGRKGTL